MQIVLILLLGSLTLGLAYEKLDRKAWLSLGGLIVFAVIAFLYFKRFL